MSGSTVALALALIASGVVSWRAHTTSRCQARALELLSTRGASPQWGGETRSLNTLLSAGSLSLVACTWSGEVELEWRGDLRLDDVKRGEAPSRRGLNIERSLVTYQPKTLYIQTLSSSASDAVISTVTSPRPLARWRYAVEGDRSDEWSSLDQLFDLPLLSSSRQPHTRPIQRPSQQD